MRVDLLCQVLLDNDDLEAWVQKAWLRNAFPEVDIDLLQGEGKLWFRTVSQT